MANHFRILGVAFSSNNTLLNEFIARLKAGHWAEDRDGMCPDIRILTKDGAIDLGDCKFMPEFAGGDVGEQVASFLRDDVLGDLAGFAIPFDTAKLAIIAEARGGIPVGFFMRVIEEFHSDGLRFFFKCFDLSDLDDGTLREYRVFHSTGVPSKNRISPHTSYFSMPPTDPLNGVGSGEHPCREGWGA